MYVENFDPKQTKHIRSLVSSALSMCEFKEFLNIKIIINPYHRNPKYEHDGHITYTFFLSNCLFLLLLDKAFAKVTTIDIITDGRQGMTIIDCFTLKIYFN